MRIAQDWGAPSRLVEATVQVNDARKSSMAARIIQAAGGNIHGKTVAVLGLTFKPETDDMRDAPSVPIISRLAEEGAAVRAFDPVGMEQARPALPPNVTFCADAYDAATGADVLVVVTEWNDFRALAPEKLKSLMRGKLVMDLRNVFDPHAIMGAGLEYRGIGRSAQPGIPAEPNPD